MVWKHQLSRHERGYGTQWDKLRKRILIRDKYLCQVCLKQGIPTPAKQVDHIIPKAQLGTDDTDNLQSICIPCHKAKTKAETSKRPVIGLDGWPAGPERFGYSIPDGVKQSAIPVILVCGPPAAGKSTYVNKYATVNDTVLDLDILKIKAGGTKRDKRSYIIKKAIRLRDNEILNLHKKKKGTCYLICTAKSTDERKQWKKALGNVTIKVIDTPETVCIERIKSSSERTEVATEQIQVVKDWWNYQ